MSTLFVIAVTALALAIVVARRRTVAVVLVAVQSMALGVYALVHGFGVPVIDLGGLDLHGPIVLRSAAPLQPVTQGVAATPRRRP